MKQRHVFFAAFFSSMAVVLCAFGLLYMVIDLRVSETDTPQNQVPMKMPGVEDSKTVFVAMGDEEAPYFFLFKFNAIQDKIGILGLSPSYEWEESGGTVQDSYDKAGVLQCITDIQEYLGINVDYYIQCSWQQLAQITGELEDFGIDEMSENLPVPIKNFLLKNAENIDADTLINALDKAGGLLDNQLGLAFMNECAYLLIKHNLDSLCRGPGQTISDMYSRLDTNLNTRALERFENIIGFFQLSEPQFSRQIIVKGDSDGAQKAQEVFS